MKIEAWKKREIREYTIMFATLVGLRIDHDGLIRTLHSFHLIQIAVRKEECHGYRRSVPVLACDRPNKNVIPKINENKKN
jgi:hypothetical protein